MDLTKTGKSLYYEKLYLIWTFLITKIGSMNFWYQSNYNHSSQNLRKAL